VRVKIIVTATESTISIATHGEQYLGTDIVLNVGTKEKAGTGGKIIKCEGENHGRDTITIRG